MLCYHIAGPFFGVGCKKVALHSRDAKVKGNPTIQLLYIMLNNSVSEIDAELVLWSS